MVGVKTCSARLVEKALDEFHVVRRRGRVETTCYCKPCNKERMKVYHAENRERLNAASAERYRNRPQEVVDAERVKAVGSSRKWREANPEKSRQNSTESARRRRLRVLGITEEDYDQMVSEQGDRCAICNRSDNGKFGTWAVDHDHETGEVRGLLCNPCNSAIGLMNDNPGVLMNAISYLHRTNQP